MSDCKKTPCDGCDDSALSTNPPCPGNEVDCPDPNPCPESFDMQCIIYTGDDISCGEEVIASSGDRLTDVLQALINCIQG